MEDSMTLADVLDENERLRAALSPFGDAYSLAAKLCKSQTLGDWEALAKHHTPNGAYRTAHFALLSSGLRHDPH